MTVVADRRADAARFSEELRRRLDAAGPESGDTRVVGVEHEFAVFRDREQADFASMIHSLGVPGRRLHPTNPDLYLTASGGAIMADGPVAEVATPPLPVVPGFTARLDRSLRVTGRLLENLLPEGDRLEGGSTHISVRVHPALVDRVAARYARTYAAVMMLLMDRPHSPGLLVRPRPGRLELGGEYVAGRELRIAAIFAAASAAVVERQVQTSGEGLPPLLDVRLEPARRRYGWYVDRAAFGPDLYAAGRQAQLRLAAGGTVSAQEYLEYAWQLVRPAAATLATRAELRLVDRVVAGLDSLPLEIVEHSTGIPGGAARAPEHQIGRALGVRTRPGYAVTPAYATWDWMAFAAGTDGSRVFVTIPTDRLDVFLDELEAGRLDDVIAGYRNHASGARVLRLHAQTDRPSLQDRVEPGPALLPEDRYGIGTGPVSAIRPGKRLPATESRFSRTRNGMAVSAAALMLAGFLLSLVAAVLGPQAPGARAQEGDLPDPRARPASISAIVGPSGQLWLRVEFAEPWDSVPPRDVFSLFFSLTVDAGAQGSFVGWQTHDNVEESLSDLPAFILSDGSVVLATEIFDPVGDVTVATESGSWQDEDTTSAIFTSGSFTIPAADVRSGDFSGFGTAVFDLTTGTPLSPPPATVDLATIVGGDVPLDVVGDGTVTDDTGDNQDYYGLFDSGLPDVASVTWQQVEFAEGMGSATLLSRLEDICGGLLGPGTTAVCPDDLSALASADGWAWVDVRYGGPMDPLQAGIAWTDTNRPVFSGPDSDPNTGRNTSLEVFATPDGYAVGTTRFDGDFTSEPSNDVAAILRPDGVSLIVSAAALADCTNPVLFVVGPGGIDLVDLPDPPASMVTVGVTTTTTTSGGTTQGPSSTTTTVPEATPGTAPGTTTTTAAATAPSTTLPKSTPGSGTNPLWPILIGFGLLLIAVGLWLFFRRDGGLVSIPVGFEKGNAGGTAAAGPP